MSDIVPYPIITTFRTERECDRRQTMMDQLVTRHKQLELTFENRDERNIQRYVLVARCICSVFCLDDLFLAL